MPTVKRLKGSFSFIKGKWTAIFVLVWFVVLSLGCPTNLLAADTNVNVRVCPSTSYPPPTISSPADGTKTQQSSILMSGEATPNVIVYAYRNDVQTGFVTSGIDGTFAISISLDMGTNVLKASTNNECSAPSFSGSVTVEREAVVVPPGPTDGDEDGGEPVGLPGGPQPIGIPPTVGQPSQGEPTADQPSEAPHPVIREPRQGTRATQPFILVVGEASPFTLVRILRNGQVVAEVFTDSKGRFTVGVPLELGENRLVAVTGQGSEERFSEEVRVTYQPEATSSIVRPLKTTPLAFLFIISFILSLILLFVLLRRRKDATDDTKQQ